VLLVDCILSLDIGGTSIKYGLVDNDGELVYKSKCPSEAHKGAEFLMHNVKRVIKETIQHNQDTNILGIGIASAGQINCTNGNVIFATPNIPGYTSMDLKGIIETEFGMRTCVENDVNAVAIGEAWKGSGKGKHKILCVSIGTGIGGCIMFDGKVEYGTIGSAGEIGHIIINYNGLPCNCGNKGCLEQYASATAMVRNFKNKTREGAVFSVLGLNNEKHQIDSQMIFQAARDGDALANCVVDEFISYLGTGLISLIHTLNPELIIIGGGVSNEGKYLSDKVYDYISKHVMPSFLINLRIVTAALGNDAGVVGAAKIVYDSISYGK
jgi:glucokinase